MTADQPRVNWSVAFRLANRHDDLQMPCRPVSFRNGAVASGMEPGVTLSNSALLAAADFETSKCNESEPGSGTAAAVKLHQHMLDVHPFVIPLPRPFPFPHAADDHGAAEGDGRQSWCISWDLANPPKRAGVVGLV